MLWLLHTFSVAFTMYIIYIYSMGHIYHIYIYIGIFIHFISHTCAKPWNPCMPDEMSKKKSCVGDPSWKVHFQNMSEMQVLRTFRVEKRATPSKGSSLVLFVCVFVCWFVCWFAWLVGWLLVCLFVFFWDEQLHDHFHGGIYKSVILFYFDG